MGGKITSIMIDVSNFVIIMHSELVQSFASIIFYGIIVSAAIQVLILTIIIK